MNRPSLQITAGAVPRMAALVGNTGQMVFQPVLQLLEVRKMPTGNANNPPRYKLLLSDGTYFFPAMLAAQLQHLFNDPSNFQINMLIQCLDYSMQIVASGKSTEEKSLVCIIMNVALGQTLPERIGNPVAYSATSAPPPEQPHAQQGAYGQPPQQPYHQQQQQQQAPVNGGGAPAYGAPQYGGGANPYAQHQAPPHASGAYNQPQNDAFLGNAQGGAYGQPAGGYGGSAYPYGQPGGGNPYGGAVVAPAPRYDNRGAVARNTSATHYTPIKDVGPYISRWVIKGRVTTKGDLKRYHKNGSDGCVFNFEMADSSGEVRIVAFKEVAEKFFDKIHEGRCYTLGKASAKPLDGNKRKWNQTGHECEIMLDRGSEIDEVPDDASTSEMPRVHLKLVRISDVETLAAGEMCDVMGVLESCGDWATINRRDGTEAKKRSFVIKDDSARSIEVTLWGDKVDTPGGRLYDAASAGQNPVVCVKSARVGDFNGKSLSTISTSAVLVDPEDVDGVDRLRSWFAGGGAAAVQPLSVAGKGGRSDRRATLAAIRDEGLGRGEAGAAYVKVMGTVMTFKTDHMTYPACMQDHNGRKCQKKMNDQGGDNGQLHCERHGFSEPTYRYMLQFSCQDFTGCLDHISAFGEVGESVLGVPPEVAHEVEQNNTDVAEYFHDKLFRSCIFKLKVFEDTYQEESRVKHTLLSCEDVDFAADSKALVAMLEDMAVGRPIAMMQARGPAGAAAGPSTSPAPAFHGGAYGGGAPGGYQHGQPAAGGYNSPPPRPGGGYQGGYQGGAAQDGGGWNPQVQAAQAAPFLNNSFGGY